MTDDPKRPDDTPPGPASGVRRIKGPILTVAGERSPSRARRRLAAGTDVVPLEPKHAYRVTVRYREPGYERRHGRRPEPYRWTFHVDARSEPDAVELAVAEFHAIARESSVSWTRDIVGVCVESEPEAEQGDDA